MFKDRIINPMCHHLPVCAGWKHLPLCADALVGRNIDCVCDGLVANSQAQVSNSTHVVLLHQDIFRLEITMSDTRFTYRIEDNISVQKNKPECKSFKHVVQ